MSKKVIQLNVPKSTIDTWQQIVNILAQVVDVPTALIMRLVGPDIEVFVSSRSADNPFHPGDKWPFPGSDLYCESVIKTRGMLHVPNALADENWKDNPGVDFNMISYLGFPIFMPDQTPFGTICVLSNKVIGPSETYNALIEKFRDLIQGNLEILFMNQTLGEKNKRLTDYLVELQALRGIVPICSSCKSIRDNQGNWKPIEHYIVRHSRVDFSHGICPECKKKLFPGIAKANKC